MFNSYKLKTHCKKSIYKYIKINKGYLILLYNIMDCTRLHEPIYNYILWFMKTFKTNENGIYSYI